MDNLKIDFTVVDRFLRYVKIDTQSKEDQTTVPSTHKQFDLANLLAKELKELGAQNVRVSEFAIVYATIPGNLADNSKAPVIGFIAHMDTSPAVSGQNVNPIIHKNYRGGDIVLPGDSSQVITVAKNPDLKELIGDEAAAPGVMPGALPQHQPSLPCLQPQPIPPGAVIPAPTQGTTPPAQPQPSGTTPPPGQPQAQALPQTPVQPAGQAYPAAAPQPPAFADA